MPQGLISKPSRYSVSETIDRLEAALRAAGNVIFARVDHGGDAQKAGLTLRPTQLLMFGNAKAGTPLMQAQQTIGIDLPLKFLAWEDERGSVWLSYNDLTYLAARHGISGLDDVLHAIEAKLDAAASAQT